MNHSTKLFDLGLDLRAPFILILVRVVCRLWGHVLDATCGRRITLGGTMKYLLAKYSRSFYKLDTLD